MRASTSSVIRPLASSAVIPPLLHHGDQLVPLAIGQVALRGAIRFSCGVDRERAAPAARRSRRRRVSAVPAAEARVLRDHQLRLVERQVVLRHPRRSLAERVNAPPDLRPQVVEGERPFVVLVEPLQRGFVSRRTRARNPGRALVLLACPAAAVRPADRQVGRGCRPPASAPSSFRSRTRARARAARRAAPAFAWRLRIRAVEPRPRSGVAGAERFQPSLRFFSEIFEGRGGR